MEEVDITQCTVPELRALLRGKKQKSTGNKGELVMRLRKAGVEKVSCAERELLEVVQHQEEDVQDDTVQRLVSDVSGLRGTVEALARQFQEFLQASRLPQQTAQLNPHANMYIPITTATTSITTSTTTSTTATGSCSSNFGEVQPHANVLGMRSACVPETEIAPHCEWIGRRKFTENLRCHEFWKMF